SDFRTPGVLTIVRVCILFLLRQIVIFENAQACTNCQGDEDKLGENHTCAKDWIQQVKDYLPNALEGVSMMDVKARCDRLCGFLNLPPIRNIVGHVQECLNKVDFQPNLTVQNQDYELLIEFLNYL
ncbi:unnamed protein product, partial [Owenia fusiformis]